MNLGNTQAIDVIEVDDGYVTSITSGANSISSATYLVKFDFDLNFVDSVMLPYNFTHITQSPSLRIVGDSIYALYSYSNQGVPIFYDELITFDFDLNRGNIYKLPTDSFGLTFLLTPKTDSTFIAAGTKLGTFDQMAVFEFDLTGNVINQAIFDDTSYTPFTLTLSAIPLNNNRLFVTTITSSYILNLSSNNIDKAIADTLIPELNSSHYIEMVHALNTINLGIYKLTPHSPMHLVEIDNDGSLVDLFPLDSSMIIPLFSDSSYSHGLVRGLDEDLDGNLFAISSYERKKRFDWRPQNDSVFGSVFVHKINMANKDLLWKRKINVFEVKGIGHRPFTTSIQTTSDGGCVGVFNSIGIDSINNPIGTVGFIFKLGSNGELLSQTSFDAPKPQIIIYPNPAKESLFINSHTSAVKITINDLSGRVVFQSQARQHKHQIDVQEWPKGMYVVQMIGKDGKRWTEKVLVE
ncbi:MAG: T9SS type A sorting domain-containing protein [Cryomorphaceae bacterium]|nr:T9SS type A sorting domain-containing protein [Cryomorphaceae bacterium]